MRDDDIISVTAVPTAGLCNDDSASCSSIDRIAYAEREIDSIMAVETLGQP